MLLSQSCIIFLILNSCILIDTNIINIIKSQSAELGSEQVLIRSELELMKSELALLKSELGVVDSIRSELERHDIGKLNHGHSCAERARSYYSGICEMLIPSYSNESFEVFRDMDIRGGNWTIILKRMDGSVDFYRNWDTYKHGFGNLNGEFFLGLDKIHALTAAESQELLVLLDDHGGAEVYETYEEFAIGDEEEGYALKTLGKPNGTAGDSLTYHYGQKFSTYDRDDAYSGNCANWLQGAWWYNSCRESGLTTKYENGITWSVNFVRRAVMMIRPRKMSD